MKTVLMLFALTLQLTLNNYLEKVERKLSRNKLNEINGFDPIKLRNEPWCCGICIIQKYEILLTFYHSISIIKLFLRYHYIIVIF